MTALALRKIIVNWFLSQYFGYCGECDTSPGLMTFDGEFDANELGAYIAEQIAWFKDMPEADIQAALDEAAKAIATK